MKDDIGFLDKLGVSRLWDKVCAGFGAKITLKGMTIQLRNKSDPQTIISEAAIPEATQQAAGAMSAADKKRVDAYPWDAISGKPATFAPSAHNHDDRYYTEGEIDAKLAGKSDASHKHGASDITAGTLPVARGGTGASTTYGANNSIFGEMKELTDAMADTSYIAAASVYGSADNGANGRIRVRRASNVWDYIAGKIRSAFGFNASNVLTIEHGGHGGKTAAEARANLSAIGSKTVGSYIGMTTPGGGDGAGDWIRTTQAGIIPHSHGVGSIGTATWMFGNVYAQHFILNGTSVVDLFAAKSHAHSTVNDSYNGTATKIAYSQPGVTATSWLAAWNGYELRAIAPAALRNVVGLGNTTGALPVANGGTGATSAQGACDALMTASLGTKRVIPASANLNSYKTPGSYTCNADVNAKTLANCPTGGLSFHLAVDQVLSVGTYLTQTLRQYNDEIVWMRHSTDAGATWGAWQRIWGVGATQANARTNMGITPANIGAAASSHAHNAATASSAGFMSAADKQLMDTLRTGAVTGVKGAAESAYRTGNVNVTADNVGAIPKSGGTLANGAQVKSAGISTSWVTGRNVAPYRQTSISGYSPMMSMKTANGSWEIGVYDNNRMWFSYIADADYNAGTNRQTAQFSFYPDGNMNVNGKTLLDRTYPVGAVYISYASTSPASLFGGTWTAITGRFPYFNNGTGTGGSNTHTLTIAQMPWHDHGLYKRGTGGGGGWALQTQCDYGNGWDASWVKGVGGSGSHNNMPAYQTFYAWRRTA